MHPIHKLPKLEKFLLLTAIFSGLMAFLVITIQTVISPISKFTQATIPGVIVRSWNFDTSKENWKTVNVRSSFVRNGQLNIVIGNQGYNAMTFNRLALSKLTSPLKYLTFRVAFKKNSNPLILPTQAASDILTNVDLQIINLPVTTPQTNSPTSPPPTMTTPTFLFNVYYKKLETSAWKGPIPVSGRINPDFQEFYAKFPESGQITVEALKIEFKRGLVLNDLVQFDQIALMQENAPTVSIYPTTNTSPRPTLFRNTPTPWACVTPPPCYYGIIDPATGYTRFCLPPYPNSWCLKPSPTLFPYPTKPWPSVYPSCIPRPRCLDTEPRCQIPETENMCPPTNPLTSVAL